MPASDDWFPSAFAAAPVGSALLDFDGSFRRVNPALSAQLGYAEDDLLATTLLAVTHPADRETVLAAFPRLRAGERDSGQRETRFLHRQGHIVWALTSLSLWRDAGDRPAGLLLQLPDLTERKALEERLRHQALHDPLTDLPNRTLFLDRLQHALAGAGRRVASVAVLYLDLDRFKTINDRFGHAVGDQFLVAVAQRLASGVRQGDTVARFGGDEFTVLLEGIAEPGDAIQVAERLLAALDEPLHVAGQEIATSASIGVAYGNQVSTRPDELLRGADLALYRAKANGRSRYAVFEPEQRGRAPELVDREKELRRAIEEGELRLHYQPEVDLATGKVVGLEALVRWPHPTLGVLPAAEFLPLAEATGLIVPLGRWVLTEACRQAKTWPDRSGLGPPVVGVNLSPRQLREPDLVEQVARAILEARLDPARLRLEIPAQAVAADPVEIGRILAELRAFGVQVAISGIGSNGERLADLRRVPADALKLDRALVQDAESESAEPSVAGAVTALARELGLTVTAEGIETAAQLTWARGIQGTRGQGYYFAPPLGARTIDALLATNFE